MRVRRKRLTWPWGPAPVARGRSERWSIDIVHVGLPDGRQFRKRKIVDHWSRSNPPLEVTFSILGQAVGEALDRAIGTGQTPRSSFLDPEAKFTSRLFAELRVATSCGTRLHPNWQTGRGRVGQIVQLTVRDGFLNTARFRALVDVLPILEAWRRDYNERRSIGALRHTTKEGVCQQPSGRQEHCRSGVIPASHCRKTGST